MHWDGYFLFKVTLFFSFNEFLKQRLKSEEKNFKFYILSVHRTHTGYKPLKCPYCLRPFGDPSNLNKHVRLHADGETPYRCDLCGKVLVRKRDLERHIKSRHQENVDHSSDSSSDGIDVESEIWVDSTIVTGRAHRDSPRFSSYMLLVICNSGLVEL
jgi:uncharacterized C2H2 Zn-finger protein